MRTWKLNLRDQIFSHISDVVEYKGDAPDSKDIVEVVELGEYDKLKAEVEVLRSGLIYYAHLQGSPIRWPHCDEYSYLEDPAIRALADANRLRGEK